MEKNIRQKVAERMAGDPQFKKDVEQIQTVEALMVYAEEHGVSMTKEEAAAFLPLFQEIIKGDKTLTDESLSMVSGGISYPMAYSKLLLSSSGN